MAERAAIILAAGVSSRMKTQLAKVMHIKPGTVVSQEDIDKFGKK